MNDKNRNQKGKKSKIEKKMKCFRTYVVRKKGKQVSRASRNEILIHPIQADYYFFFGLRGRSSITVFHRDDEHGIQKTMDATGRLIHFHIV